ncbi:S1 family peptidase [Enhygromyxa salina]|uniref:Trypsin n=1 Tax=Enhygromyxa salina TaxID=215803 RepID=A0A2S9YP46_9BACT|nr:serine protease [Enhygromyxa salina]PRQ06865.1 Trypsin [Enhygromyxa salina]
MSRVYSRRTDLALLALACTSALACAGSPSEPTLSADASPTTSPAATGPAAAQHGVLPNASALEESHGMHAPNTAGLLRTAQSGETSYDVSAPATVLVTTRWGHGSGVHIGDGLVLTNFHVIADALTDEFQFEVEVTTVDIQKNGSVKPGPRYDAIALEVDPKRDLALLRVAGVPPGLASISLATDPPKPGRRVAAIGNAGVGFGWAVKHCNINAIGTLESRAAAMVHLRGETWTEAERAEMSEYLAKAAADAGLQIQTDCTILPGDSGGPLIDEQTHALVGLNASVTSALSHDKTIGTVAYHIHVDELREFVAVVPSEPVTWIPDPWEVAGFEGSLADVDRDGEFDSILVHGSCNESMSCHGLFVDVDQDTFASGTPVPKLSELYGDRSFDAEMVAFRRPRLPRTEASAGGRPAPVSDLFIYLDRDNDGDLDSLIVQNGETEQVIGFAGLDASVTRDPSLDGASGLDGRLFADAAIGERVASFADVFERPSHDPRAPTRTNAIELEFDDHDDDGKADTLYAQTRLDIRVLIDADQDSIAGFANNAEASAALAAGSVDAEFMVVDSTPLRVWYDTDNDGEFDLLLVGSSLARGVVVEATSYTPDGKAVAAPIHIGRRMLRPGLLADPGQAATLERMFGHAFPQAHADVDDGLSSFPDMTVHRGAMIGEVEGSKRAAVHVVEFDRIMLFADLDRDSFKGKDRKQLSVEEALHAGSYEAEFVFVYDGIMAWAYYDSDNDGSFDQVLVSRFGDPLHAEEVFTLGAQLEAQTPSEITPMFDSARVGSKQRAAFKQFEALALDPEASKESR